MRRARRHRKLRILRDDHIGDLLGAIFFDIAPGHDQAILERLGDYLGPRVHIVMAELTAGAAEVEVEVQALEEEASRLADAADDLRLKGARRGAYALYREALELDSLNHAANFGLGLLLADREDFEPALKLLKLAREAGGDHAELLLAMGRVCMRTERLASAINYLERAFQLEPGNFVVRRTLADLGRRPKAPPRQPSSENPPNPGKDAPANKRQ